MLRTLKLQKTFLLKRKDLVLEIGSGADPLLRSDVLLDKYPLISTLHRTSLRPVEIDERPFIIGDAQSLPFVDDAFDFVVARHVIEHLNSPAQFIKEIKRVGKAGYITTPSPFTELVHGGYQNIDKSIPADIAAALHHGRGTPGHKWFVLGNNGKIYMTAKTKNLYNLYLLLGSFIKKNTDYKRDNFYKKNSQWLETSIYWKKDSLELFILQDKDDNTEETVAVEKLISDLRSVNKKGNIKSFIKSIIRKSYYSSDKKQKTAALLACPICRKKLVQGKNSFICTACGQYPIVNNIPILLRESLNQGISS